MKYATGVAKWCRRWSEETTTNKISLVPPKPILMLIWHQKGQDMANLWDNADEYSRLLEYWKLPADCSPDAGVGINQYI